MAKEKRDDHFEASQELAHKRLAKANNVQRRRFEKMADAAIHRAQAKQQSDRQEQLTIIEQAVVRKTMGEDYDRLMAVRDRVLSLKAQIKLYQDAAEPIRKRLAQVGIDTSHGYRAGRNWDYYVNPVPVDPEDQSCSTVVGDPTVTLGIVHCRTKDAYVEYERRSLELDLEDDVLTDAGEQLRAAVWQLTTTDEIVDAINKLKETYDA